MTAQALERIVMAAARGVLARIDTRAQGGVIRTQAAVVRSLVDELDRHLGSEGCAVCLRDQVKEELLRLMQLVGGSMPGEALANTLPLHEPTPWYDDVA
jgi:hypothetical protein